MKIIEEVKKIRHDLGLSQHELGEKLGRNRDHIKDIECGRKKISAEDYLAIKQLHYCHRRRSDATGTAIS